MELIKIINARNIIESFIDKEDIEGHLAYWMTKFVVSTQHEHDFYISEMKKIIEKYSDKTKMEEGGITIPQNNIEAFNNATKALEMTNVEAPQIKFNLSELASNLKMSMRQMYPLLDFIDEDK